MSDDVVTLGWTQAPPAPAEGTAWQFVASRRGEWVRLRPIALPDAGDPDPPPGSSWRLLRRGGQLVYVATPQPFLRGLPDGY